MTMCNRSSGVPLNSHEVVRGGAPAAAGVVELAGASGDENVSPGRGALSDWAISRGYPGPRYSFPGRLCPLSFAGSRCLFISRHLCRRVGVNASCMGAAALPASASSLISCNALERLRSGLEYKIKHSFGFASRSFRWESSRISPGAPIRLQIYIVLGVEGWRYKLFASSRSPAEFCFSDWSRLLNEAS